MFRTPRITWSVLDPRPRFLALVRLTPDSTASIVQSHRSPLAVVKDVQDRRRLRRKKSWTHSISSKLPFVKGGLPGYPNARSPSPASPSDPDRRYATLPRIRSASRSPSVFFNGAAASQATPETEEAQDSYFAPTGNDEDYYPLEESDKPLRERVRTPGARLASEEDVEEEDVEEEEEETEQVLDLDAQQLALTVEAERAQKALRRALRGKKASPIGTRLTMTSRSSFFADRIIPPSMVSLDRSPFGRGSTVLK